MFVPAASTASDQQWDQFHKPDCSCHRSALLHRSGISCSFYCCHGDCVHIRTQSESTQITLTLTHVLTGVGVSHPEESKVMENLIIDPTTSHTLSKHSTI